MKDVYWRSLNTFCEKLSTEGNCIKLQYSDIDFPISTFNTFNKVLSLKMGSISSTTMGRDFVHIWDTPMLVFEFGTLGSKWWWWWSLLMWATKYRHTRISWQWWWWYVLMWALAYQDIMTMMMVMMMICIDVGIGIPGYHDILSWLSGTGSDDISSQIKSHRLEIRSQFKLDNNTNGILNPSQTTPNKFPMTRIE